MNVVHYLPNADAPRIGEMRRAGRYPKGITALSSQRLWRKWQADKAKSRASEISKLKIQLADAHEYVRHVQRLMHQTLEAHAIEMQRDRVTKTVESALAILKRSSGA